MTAGTIAGLLDESASARPDRPLLRDTAGETLAIADFVTLTAGGTHWLWRAGVRPGMTVAWQLPSNVAAALLMLSLARTGVTQAPVLHIHREREVAAAHDVARADFLVVDESTAANALSGACVIQLPCDFVERLRALPDRAHPGLDGPRSPQDTRWLYLTSGTTGRPKRVWHSDATLLAAARGYVRHLGLGEHPDEVGTIAFPIAHIGGMVYLAAALLADVPLLMVPKVADDLPGLLARHRVTVTGASTAFYQMLLSAQHASGRNQPLIPSLRMLIGGGAACPPELHKRVREHMGIPIVHAYGMTEAAMVCVSLATDTDEQQSNSSGLPIPGAAVRISATGEIELRGANLTSGYVNAGQWACAITPDGWFRTGDRATCGPTVAL